MEWYSPPSSSPPKPRFKAGMPMCCAKGEKSEPEPSASSSKIFFASNSFFVLTEPALIISADLLLSNTLTLACGSFTSLTISVNAGSSACDPPAPKKPRPLPSELMYNTAFCCSSAAWYSTHSVEPSSPGSSPSQAQYIMVRLGYTRSLPFHQ